MTPGVDFTNVFCARFSYKRLFSSYCATFVQKTRAKNVGEIDTSSILEGSKMMLLESLKNCLIFTRAPCTTKKIMLAKSCLESSAASRNTGCIHYSPEGMFL